MLFIHPTSEGSGQGRPQGYRRPTPRGSARQETYKLSRRRAEFEGSDIIRFVVNGEEGIRLSDALEDNWEGLEGRDDRSLFRGDRLQVILRLQVRDSVCPLSALLTDPPSQLVGCSPWHSKVDPTTVGLCRSHTCRRSPQWTSLRNADQSQE